MSSSIDPISSSTGFESLRNTVEPQSAAGSAFSGLASGAISALGGAMGSVVGIEPGYAALIMQQMYQQEQMQLVSLYSNIEKSKHETQMSAIRNVRVG